MRSLSGASCFGRTFRGRILESFRGIPVRRPILSARLKGLKPRRVAFFPASFKLIAIGANDRHPKMFRFSGEWIDTERFVGDTEGFPPVSKMPDDFGYIGVPAMGAIHCTNNVYVFVMPMIFMVVSRRMFVLRIGAHRAQEGEQYR
jgi:hypothetical protein